MEDDPKDPDPVAAKKPRIADDEMPEVMDICKASKL